MSGDNGDTLPKDLETVNLEDLIIAVKRNKDGKIETLVGPSNRQELEIALMRITHQCFGIFNAMSHAEQQSKIIEKPQGSILDFVRRGKRR